MINSRDYWTETKCRRGLITTCTARDKRRFTMERRLYYNLSSGGRRNFSRGRAILVGRERNSRGSAKLFQVCSNFLRGGEIFLGVEKLF